MPVQDFTCMRALYNQRYGGYEVLQVRQEPDPVPAGGEVLIEVVRAGLNFADVSARMGLYPDAPKPPMVMGYEVAGTVRIAAGSLRVGQRVLAVTRFKGHATHVCVPATHVFPIPEAMSFDQAAALPVNYLTAYHMLFHVGRLRPFDHVLIHMAAGGVGLAAIQLCKQVEGVQLYGTASASKHTLLREVGVQHPIDYRTTDYCQEVRRLTQGKGVQLVLDPLGGGDWRKGYELLAPTGHLIAFGFSNLVQGRKRRVIQVVAQLLGMPRYSPLELMNTNRTLSGVNMGRLWGNIEVLDSHMRVLLGLYERGAITPRVDQVFPLEKAAEAHRFMQERKNVGKVLLACA
jgi:NADPH:quinone reductase-like Zn-dependent oxidoreductase